MFTGWVTVEEVGALRAKRLHMGFRSDKQAATFIAMICIPIFHEVSPVTQDLLTLNVIYGRATVSPRYFSNGSYPGAVCSRAKPWSRQKVARGGRSSSIRLEIAEQDRARRGIPVAPGGASERLKLLISRGLRRRATS